jgi:hypothetical protein
LAVAAIDSHYENTDSALINQGFQGLKIYKDMIRLQKDKRGKYRWNTGIFTTATNSAQGAR